MYMACIFLVILFQEACITDLEKHQEGSQDWDKFYVRRH